MLRYCWPSETSSVTDSQLGWTPPRRRISDRESLRKNERGLRRAYERPAGTNSTSPPGTACLIIFSTSSIVVVTAALNSPGSQFSVSGMMPSSAMRSRLSWQNWIMSPMY